MPSACVSRSSLALTRLTSRRRLAGVCCPSPTWMWMPQVASAFAPARRRARTTSWTIPISSQRHTGLTTSAQGSVTDPSRSTVQWRPSGMGTCQSSRCRPTYRGVVPKCAAMARAARSRPRPVVSISIPKVWVFTGFPPFCPAVFPPAAAAFGFCLFSGRDIFITPPGRKSNPMKSTRFSGKISSDPTKKAGEKTPLPY